ncbi:MAG: hypothetical protein IV089_08510 [Thiobacillus sp.]|nr:hypothetical protein [Thiobacillus sp.]
MLRTLLIATALLTTSGAALARDGDEYGRVISVEPSFSISFGTRHHDGYRVQYESGGHHYWTHSPHHPGHYFVLPPQHYVQSNYGYRDHGWRGHERHHWKGHREDRRHDRHDDREYRRHDRY